MVHSKSANTCSYYTNDFRWFKVSWHLSMNPSLTILSVRTWQVRIFLFIKSLLKDEILLSRWVHQWPGKIPQKSWTVHQDERRKTSLRWLVGVFIVMNDILFNCTFWLGDNSQLTLIFSIDNCELSQSHSYWQSLRSFWKEHQTYLRYKLCQGRCCVLVI